MQVDLDPQQMASNASELEAKPEFSRDLSKCKGLEQHGKWLVKELKQQQKAALKDPTVSAATYLPSNLKPGVLKDVTKILKKNLPLSQSAITLPAQHAGLQDHVFCAQVFCMSDRQKHLGLNSFCTGEFRVLLKGSYHIAAWRLEDLGGETLNDKLTMFHDSKNQQAIVDKANCYTWHNQGGSTVYIPLRHGVRDLV